MGSNIEDYRVLDQLFVGNGIVGYKTVDEFAEEVNGFLQKGYTLHGTTSIQGHYSGDLSVTQVVIKYSNANENKISKYKLVHGQFCYKFGNQRYMNGEKQDMADKHLFEMTVSEGLRSGWSLHGDLQFIKMARESPHLIQALVKYRPVLLMPKASEQHQIS
jgi:hypothetical protein